MKVDYGRARRAYELRRRGLKLHEIGKELGISPSHARLQVLRGERITRAEAALQDDPDNVQLLCDARRLPPRVATALKREGIKQLTDLTRYDARALLRLPRIGKSGVEEVKALLASRGLSLPDDPNEEPRRSPPARPWSSNPAQLEFGSEVAELAKRLTERYDADQLSDLVERLIKTLKER